MAQTKTVNESLEKLPIKRCTVLLTKGKRNGLECKRKITQEGDDFCKFHSNKSLDSVLCSVILTKGERKNQTCNRRIVAGVENIDPSETLCKIHRGIEDSRPYNPFVDKEKPVEIVGNTINSDLGTIPVSIFSHDLIEIVRSRA